MLVEVMLALVLVAGPMQGVSSEHTVHVNRSNIGTA